MTSRIIYITESSGYGGAERYLLYLAGGVGNGADVSVALPFKACNLKFRELLIEQGITVLDLPQYRALYPLNLLLAFRFFSRHSQGLFHFSLPYTDSCRWLLTAAALLGRTYLITEHLVPPDPYRAGAYFAITHLLFNPLKKFSYERARRVIAVSNGNRDILTRTYGMPSGKMTVIHNGIDCARYESDPRAAERLRAELAIPVGSLVLTNVGRLAEQKGQTYLLAALEILARENLPLVLLLVGDGPLREALEAEAKARGLADLVRFAGFRNDIPAVLGITDIFVLASLNEGFPLTLLEAMAAGKPVIATRVTGTEEAVIDGDTGLLCRPASPGDLAEKVRLLAGDGALRSGLGERARQAALERFDSAGMVAKTSALYAEDAPCAGA